MAKKKNNELQSIFEEMKLDENIFTEEVMNKIKLVIEAKVNDKLEVEKSNLEEANKAELGEFKEGLITQLDEYMSYFVEEFTNENKQEIYDSVKIKNAERILENFNTMVNDFNVSLSEETVDQSGKINGLEAELNDSINENIELKKEMAVSNKNTLIRETIEKIEIDSEKSKFTKLAESFDYEDDDTFKEKLNTLQESLEITIEDDDNNTLIEAESSNNKTLLKEQSNVSSKKKEYLKVLNRTA